MTRSLLLAASAVVTLSTAVSAEEYRMMFFGKGFFPEVTYANPSDDIRLINATGSQITVTLRGDVEIYNDGDDDSDDGYTTTLGEDGEVRFEADNSDGANGADDDDYYDNFEVIVEVIVAGDSNVYSGVITFDDPPDIGYGTGGYTGDWSGNDGS